MADKTEKDAAPAEGGKKKSKLPLILLAVLLPIGGVAGGVFLAPKLLHKEKPAAAKADHGEEESSTNSEHAEGAPAEEQPSSNKEEPPVSVQWPPLVVDVRDEGGSSRHVKIVVTVEATNDKTLKEITAFMPRARAAVLGYLREQKFEYLTDSKTFPEVQKKVEELVRKQVGKKRSPHVWITDLVAQ